jgi:hypothetical protein
MNGDSMSRRELIRMTGGLLAIPAIAREGVAWLQSAGSPPA